MKTEKKPTLRLAWSRQPNETGLARIGQVERGWVLKTSGDKRRVASVGPLSGGRRWETVGWYCVARRDDLNVPWFNTADTKQPTRTPAESMTAAERHVLAHLSESFRVVIRRPRGMGNAESTP